MIGPPSHRGWMGCLWLALGIIFAISHTWSPLYYSNQNQYFLHGLAQGGVGELRFDWLANTRDPTPVFSMFVEGISQFPGPAAFQLFFAGMLVIYFTSLMWLVEGIAPEVSLPAKLSIAGLLIALHSAFPRYWMAKWLGVDFLWYTQCGVAGQYVLGPGLQPSVFGVFMVAALAAYANDRPVSAILHATLAAVLHATYLLPAGLFTLAVMFDHFRRGQKWQAIGLLVLALVLMLPTLDYLWRTFQPTDACFFGVAQDVLVNTRIPHHARVDCWLDIVAALQWTWIGFGVVLSRGGPLRFVCTFVIVGAGVLTVLQLLTMNQTLALLFPWRVSAILMPIATTVLLTRSVGWLPRSISWCVALITIPLSLAGGIFVFVGGIGYVVTEAERGLMEHVARHRDFRNVYLLPIRIPDIRSEPAGSQSLTFNARPRPANVIPWDFQRFRLGTGARTYVDFKSIPYADADVFEWWQRMKHAERWYKNPDWGSRIRLWELRQEGITHIVVPRTMQLPAANYQEEYADAHYRLYRLVK